MNTMTLVLLLSLAATVGTTPAESSADGNAALRYWMAFATMENPPATDALAKRLEAVSEGRVPWDESLAEVVDRNHDALATMHRGSRLPLCDWGLEDEMLIDAPIAHIARGRTLARLNVLHGRRLLDRGKPREAVEAWLAGIRFSRHLAEGGPWLSALVAGTSLESHFRALEATAREGKLDAATRRAVERELLAMPEDGFGWSAAAQRESLTLRGMAAQLEESDDPVAMLRAYYRDGDRPANTEQIATFLGLQAAQLTDRAAVRAALRRTRTAIEELRPLTVAAFQEPYVASIDPLREVDEQAAQDPVLAKVWPRTSRMNESRGRVVQARADLLEIVRAR